MAKSLSYHLVDVFTTNPLEGNPLTVFPDATGVDRLTMQRIARELNLSETSFVLPAESSGDAIRIRIFTPTYEMAFAGHPTIGTAYMLRELGLVPRDAKAFTLLENVGRVPVRVDAGDDPIIWLTTPPIERLGEYPRARCAAMLSLDETHLLPNVPCELLSAGNPNLYIALRDPAAVDAVQFDTAVFAEVLRDRDTPTCIFTFTPTPTGAYSRMFAPLLGVPEDPATGSATGPLAAFMMTHGLAPHADGARFVSEQGTKMGRRSVLHVIVHGERGSAGIEVGGNVARVANAMMHLP